MLFILCLLYCTVATVKAIFNGELKNGSWLFSPVKLNPLKKIDLHYSSAIQDCCSVQLANLEAIESRTQPCKQRQSVKKKMNRVILLRYFWMIKKLNSVFRSLLYATMMCCQFWISIACNYWLVKNNNCPASPTVYSDPTTKREFHPYSSLGHHPVFVFKNFFWSLDFCLVHLLRTNSIDFDALFFVLVVVVVYR